jgi:hypothetical protein
MIAVSTMSNTWISLYFMHSVASKRIVKIRMIANAVAVLVNQFAVVGNPYELERGLVSGSLRGAPRPGEDQ